jgi:hypothetical protein
MEFSGFSLLISHLIKKLCKNDLNLAIYNDEQVKLFERGGLAIFFGVG